MPPVSSGDILSFYGWKFSGQKKLYFSILVISDNDKKQDLEDVHVRLLDNGKDTEKVLRYYFDRDTGKQNAIRLFGAHTLSSLGLLICRTKQDLDKFCDPSQWNIMTSVALTPKEMLQWKDLKEKKNLYNFSTGTCTQSLSPSTTAFGLLSSKYRRSCFTWNGARADVLEKLPPMNGFKLKSRFCTQWLLLTLNWLWETAPTAVVSPKREVMVSTSGFPEWKEISPSVNLWSAFLYLLPFSDGYVSSTKCVYKSGLMTLLTLLKNASEVDADETETHKVVKAIIAFVSDYNAWFPPIPLLQTWVSWGNRMFEKRVRLMGTGTKVIELSSVMNENKFAYARYASKPNWSSLLSFVRASLHADKQQQQAANPRGEQIAILQFYQGFLAGDIDLLQVDARAKKQETQQKTEWYWNYNKQAFMSFGGDEVVAISAAALQTLTVDLFNESSYKAFDPQSTRLALLHHASDKSLILVSPPGSEHRWKYVNPAEIVAKVGLLGVQLEEELQLIRKRLNLRLSLVREGETVRLIKSRLCFFGQTILFYDFGESFKPLPQERECFEFFQDLVRILPDVIHQNHNDLRAIQVKAEASVDWLFWRSEICAWIDKMQGLPALSVLRPRGKAYRSMDEKSRYTIEAWMNEIATVIRNPSVKSVICCVSSTRCNSFGSAINGNFKKTAQALKFEDGALQTAEGQKSLAM